jgi:hypothetical protein
MNRFLTSIVLIGLIFVFAQIVIKSSTDRIESMKYSVIKEFEGFEIRSYPEQIVASTQLSAKSYEEAARAGFRTVAGYIFGGNQSQEKIAMTSPVVMDLRESVEMSFIMPSGYTLSSLPKPNDQNVNLTLRRADTVAVIQFDGFASDKVIDNKINELKHYLQNENIQFDNEFSYMGYSPPYQMIGRRNEVCVSVKFKNNEN